MDKQREKLKRTLTFPQLIFYGVGTILGLGIYVLLGKIAGEAKMLAPMAFIVAAILASFTGMSYGELSARIPKSAGEVNYVDEAFGIKWLSMLIGWLIVISAIISTATVVNGYVGYVQVFLDWPGWLIIVLFMVLIGAVAIKGISETAATITVITIIELVGLFFVIFVAGDTLQSLPSRWRELLPGFNIGDWQHIFSGAFLAFFAFIGFEDMVNVSEEARHPKKHMLPAIVISVAVLTILYVVVAVIGTLGLTPEELNQSDAPLADILAVKGSEYSKVISAIGLVAIVNGVLVQVVMGSRVLYGMAEKNLAPDLFGSVNRMTRTPIYATLLMIVTILMLALSFELQVLAEATNYVLLLVFTLVNSALWRIKRKNPRPDRVYTLPLAVPILGFLFSLGVLLYQILNTFIYE